MPTTPAHEPSDPLPSHPPPSDPPPSDPPPSTRRQARGLRRIADILAATEAVLGEVGFAAMTTNAVAARAGISPGSLYQFFRNKEQLVEALAQRYVEHLTAAQAAAVDQRRDQPDETVEQFVDRAVDNMVTFNLTNPAFHELFVADDPQSTLYAAVAPLKEQLQQRIRDALRRLSPSLSEESADLHGLVALQIGRGLMPVIAAEGDPVRRDTLIGELKAALLAYLAPPLARR